MSENTNIVMTLLVRNEQDIIEDNIRFHQHQGVRSFVIMDNLSTDCTRDIIQHLSREVPIEYIHQPDDDYDQTAWVTEMARRAYSDHNADWVINNDADEFWLPDNGTLASFLESMPSNHGILRVARHNAVLLRRGFQPTLSKAHPRQSTLFDTLSTNSLGHPLPRKCIHRAAETACVSQGNHHVSGVSGIEVDLQEGIRILHYPYRSLDQYKRKIALGGAAYNRNDKVPEAYGLTWRVHYKALDTGAVDSFWTSLSRGESEALIDRMEGRVFEDRRVAEFLQIHSSNETERRVSSSLDVLHSETQVQVATFVKSKSALITGFPRSERKRRPLFYNLQFCLSGAQRHLDEVTALVRKGPAHDFSNDLPAFRDLFSLFPQNSSVEAFLGDLLFTLYAEAATRLMSDCNNRRVILHLSCVERLSLAEKSISSFQDDGLGEYHHIIVVGEVGAQSEELTGLAMKYDGRILSVPIPDDYENLHRKIFYALTVIHLVAKPSLIIKVDDNLHLGDAAIFERTLSSVVAERAEYAGRLIGAATHQEQWHGWHISKCGDAVIERRGYQYPLPRIYASGGYGYVLGPRAVRACAYMYLSMKEFFGMRTIGLEDAFVGHAMYAQGIELHDVSTNDGLLAFPGLLSIDAVEV